MADELVDRLAILVVVRCFPGMGVADSRSLRSDMQHFVRRSTYVPFRRLLGDARREFMQRLFAFFMAFWVPIFTTQEVIAAVLVCLLVPRP
jgi:hypothetical protein